MQKQLIKVHFCLENSRCYSKFKYDGVVIFSHLRLFLVDTTELFAMAETMS